MRPVASGQAGSDGAAVGTRFTTAQIAALLDCHPITVRPRAPLPRSDRQQSARWGDPRGTGTRRSYQDEGGQRDEGGKHPVPRTSRFSRLAWRKTDQDREPRLSCLRTPGGKSLRPELASDLLWRNGWTVAEQAGGTGGCPFGLSALSSRKLGLELLFEQLMAVHAPEHEQPRPPHRRAVPADPVMAALMARLTAARAPASLGFGVSRTIPGSTAGWCRRARTVPSPGRCCSCR